MKYILFINLFYVVCSKGCIDYGDFFLFICYIFSVFFFFFSIEEMSKKRENRDIFAMPFSVFHYLTLYLFVFSTEYLIYSSNELLKYFYFVIHLKSLC